MTSSANSAPPESHTHLVLFAHERLVAAIAPVLVRKLGGFGLTVETYFDQGQSQMASAREIPRGEDTPPSYHPSRRLESAAGLIIGRDSVRHTGLTYGQTLSASLGTYATRKMIPQLSLVPREVLGSGTEMIPPIHYTRRGYGEVNQIKSGEINMILVLSELPGEEEGDTSYIVLSDTESALSLWLGEVTERVTVR